MTAANLKYVAPIHRPKKTSMLTLRVNAEIKLVQLQAEHAQMLYEVANKSMEHIAHFLPAWIERTATPKSTQRYIQYYLDLSENHTGILMEIFQGSELIGRITLASSDGHMGELGWWQTQKACGQGAMTASARQFIDYIFDELGLIKIIARCEPSNTPSSRLINRLGLQSEGHERCAAKIRGEYRDLDHYSPLSTNHR